MTEKRLARFEPALAQVLLLPDVPVGSLTRRPAPGEPASALVYEQMTLTYEPSDGAERRWQICTDSNRQPAQFRELLAAFPERNE